MTAPDGTAAGYRGGAATAPGHARDHLEAVVAALAARGWPHDTWASAGMGPLTACAGPPGTVRIRVSPGDDDASPVGSASLRVSASGPAYADGDSFAWSAAPGPAPDAAAAQLDLALGDARLRLVRAADDEPQVPCPVCGDRYPARHLLPNCPGAPAVCPACVFDGDQPYRTDLPYLAARLDEAAFAWLPFPAGWDAVAAVLALCCGPGLGARLERESCNGRAARWHDPEAGSWIWLPPPGTRHPAFAGLGAGATVPALTAAIGCHDPGLRGEARRICREDGIRWRDSLWDSAVAYAVAFTTQAGERNRHRKPVHVTDSLSDGLSLIMEPFRVRGDAANVEHGLQAILERLLFPLLLGHGLHDEPVEPARVYGAAPGEARPPRRPAAASTPHDINPAVHLAAALGTAPGWREGESPWDGPAADSSGPGTAAPASALVAALRHQTRLMLASALLEARGPLHVTADGAWRLLGWWVPADDAGRALRQARDYADGVTAAIMWAGPGGTWPEPAWLDARITGVTGGGHDGAAVPGLSVQFRSHNSWMPMSDVIAVQGPHAGTPPYPASPGSR